MSFFRKVKIEMNRQEISQSDLSKKIGCSRSAINYNLKMWEKGRVPKIVTLKKWAEALGIDYKEFLSEM